jgi:proteasome lid subunit RPN8/RPN11
MLIGWADEVHEAVPARNLASSPNRFLIDPKDHLDARRNARARGLEVVGFYHSHPHSPPEPSATDVAEASYPDALYLIMSIQSSPPEARIFRLQGASLVGVPFATSDGESGRRAT